MIANLEAGHDTAAKGPFAGHHF
ncbi:MAG: hypothetical protein AVDCRST_MAG93-6598, partial [uncultured Chloroflexia bacterium]